MGFAMSRWIIWPCLFACFIVLRAKAADPPDQHLTDQQRMDEAYARLKARQAAAARAATQPAASAAGGPIEDTLQPQHAQLLAAEAALSTLAAENSIAATLAADDELEQRKLRISGSVSGICWFAPRSGARSLLSGVRLFVVHKTLAADDEAKLFSEEASVLRKRAADAQVASSPGSDDVIDLRRKAELLERGARTLVGNRDIRATWQICRKYAAEVPFVSCIHAVIVAEGKSGADGKYSIPNVAGGSYYVYASFSSPSLSLDWIMPVIVDGSNATVDLSGDSALPTGGSMKAALMDQQVKSAAKGLAALDTAEATEAKAEAAAVQARALADAATAADSGPDHAKLIANAIANRELLEGMTMVEACKAAHAHPKLLASMGGVKSYRWEIHGNLGTHTVSTIDALGNSHLETVQDYGVVGSVEATFDNGKLSSIDADGKSSFSGTEARQGELWLGN